MALSVVSVPTPRRKGMIAYDRAIDLAIWRSAKLVIVNARAIADTLSVEHDMPAHHLLEKYIEFKREQSDAVRLRPVPIEFSLYYDA